MEEHYSTGQSPQRVVAPMEEEEEEEEFIALCHHTYFHGITLSGGILLSTSSRRKVSILVPLAAFNWEPERLYGPWRHHAHTKFHENPSNKRQVFDFFTPEDGNDKLSRNVGSELDCILNVTVHALKPDFVFRRNKRVHLNRRGRQFSRLLAAEVWASAVVMLDTPSSQVVWRVLATHSIRQFPLHFPARATPCAITFQLDSTTTRCVITH